jgi:tetratricopeptide (TPR) repeat protein
MLRFYKTRIQFFFILFGTFWARAIWVLPLWFGKEILGGVLEGSSRGGGVAHWAHVGGFVVGALVAPFVGSISAAKEEYVLEDAADNVEYLRRAGEAAAAERALRADPNNAYLMRRLAQAYRHAGQYEQATRTYQRCLSSFVGRNLMGPAAEVYLELIEYDDHSGIAPDVQLKVARQLEQDRPRQAMMVYGALSEQYPATREGEFALLRLAALAIQRLGQPGDGRRYLVQFLERYPNSQWAAEARQALHSLPS